MKKLVCLLVAMILCLSCVALAAAAPSKTTSNLSASKVVTKAPVAEVVKYIELVPERTAENEHLFVMLDAELEKLAAAQPIESYFGELLDAEGNVIDLKAMLEAEALNVNEYHLVVADGWDLLDGEITVRLLFPTPYEVGEKVAVMIGIATVNADETYTIAWNVFEGVGVEVLPTEVEAQGAIEVVLDIETVLAIQEGIALLAVVSK